MNPRSVIQGLVLLAVALIAAIVYLLFHPALSISRPPDTFTQTNSITNVITRIAVRKFNATNYLYFSSQFNWSQLESTNYIEYILNLRAIGCPEETIQDIVIADIAGVYERRRAAFASSGPASNFWSAGTPYDSEQMTRRQQRRALFYEEKRLVRELLNVELEAELSKYQIEEPTTVLDLAFLDQERQIKVRDILERFELMKAGVRDLPSLLPTDRDALRAMEQQQEAELNAILSPTELEDFELRNSELSLTLRGELSGFQPTEEEFRKIYRMRKAHDDAMAGLDDVDAATARDAATTQSEALDAQMAKELGADRFQKFQQSQDQSYQLLSGVAQRYGVQEEKMQEAYNNLKLAAEHQEQLYNDSSLDDDQRDRALRLMSVETHAAISNLLGGDAFQQFRRGGGRSWLDLDSSRR